MQDTSGRPAAPLVDSHLHLDDRRFDTDRDAVLARAREAGVSAMVVPATCRAGWASIAELASRHRDVYPAYGLHPVFLAAHRGGDAEALARWLDDHAAVAVGEIGLDFHDAALDPQEQRRLFARQLAIAQERRLPVIIHARRAVEAVIMELRRHPVLRGVVHSYGGSIEQARQLWGHGFLIGLGGPLSHARAQRLHRLVAAMPLDQLLLESDAPDQPGAEHRGERNEPAWLPLTRDHVARWRDEDPDAIARATSINAERLFGLSRWTEAAGQA
ncbi:MAG TPA: TatD family hydrolase [Ramlibacter sp.]|uniref:TatD family hydrolase n=1 Tax=Ramlibacter sp. TaxID=1917967 RepID=UPI002D808269|nr:TatD family hydrolase [Ramlibacter sp.]HET8749008.1 TatD family hydrolase [Ramlibacter sp.]